MTDERDSGWRVDWGGIDGCAFDVVVVVVDVVVLSGSKSWRLFIMCSAWLSSFVLRLSSEEE